MDYEEVGEVGAAFSTLLGVGEAGRTVDVTTSVTLTFSVEEDEDDPADDDTSSASGSDASAPDDSGNDNSGDDDGEEDITDIIIDEEIPLSGFAVVELPLADVSDTESDVEEDVLFEDDIPLADVPKTGDASALWMVLSAVSGAGLFLLNKKREDN